MTESADLVCRSVVALLPDYLDDELSDDRVARLEQHLALCDGCATVLGQLRTGARALVALRPERRRDDLWARVTAAVAGGGGCGPETPWDAGAAHASEGGAVRACKFLKADRISPFAGVRWPEPGGGWVTASPGTRHRVHACRPADLAYWLGEALWLVELDGDVRSAPRALAADRGRLVRSVPEWPEAALEFAADCSGLLDALAAEDRGRDRRTARELHVYADEARATRTGHETERAAGISATGMSAPAVAVDVAYTLAHAVGAAGWVEAPARLAEWQAGARAQGIADPFEAERARQSTWLADRLGLAEPHGLTGSPDPVERREPAGDEG